MSPSVAIFWSSIQFHSEYQCAKVRVWDIKELYYLFIIHGTAGNFPPPNTYAKFSQVGKSEKRLRGDLKAQAAHACGRYQL